MPKGGRKVTNRLARRGRRHDLDDDLSGDNMSVASSTDERSVCDGSQYGDAVDPAADDSCVVWDQFIEKFDTALDQLTDKSAATRTNGLLSLCTALCRRYIPDLLADRHMTLIDCLERCMKKGRGGAEMSAAADLCHLVALQLTADSSHIQVLHQQVAPLMRFVAANASVSAGARSRCVSALSLLTLLAAPEPLQLTADAQLFQSLFDSGRQKRHSQQQSTDTAASDTAVLQQSAVQAWAILLTTLTPTELHALAERQIPNICILLDSPDVDVRVTAGETLALIYELLWRAGGNNGASDYISDNYDEMCEKLRQLATDSSKTRARKHRKVQRHSFRDILKTFEDGTTPSDRVKFGSEVLYVDSWSSRLLYDFLSSILRSGTNIHLRDNPLVRLLLSLGPPVPVCARSGAMAGDSDHVSSKMQRMYQLQENTKFRQQSRQKCRDKRTAVFD